MQCILVVSSAQQLDRCLLQIHRWISSEDALLSLWVIAEEKSAFAAIAAKRTADLGDACELTLVSDDASSLLHRFEEKRNVDWLVLPYTDEQKDLFLRLFVDSPCRTILLDPGVDSTTETNRIIEVAADDHDSINEFCGDDFNAELRTPLCQDVERLLRSGNSERKSQLNEALTGMDLQPCDIVISTVDRDECNDDYTLAKQLLDLEIPATVAIVRHRMGLVEHAWAKLEKQITRVFVPMQREDRQALADNLSANSVLNFEFIALMCAATCLASFGLVQDSAAVIIGAMLVAPLMTPIMGAGLALAYGNRPLLGRAGLTVIVGFLCALGTSAVFGLLVRMLQGAENTGEMWARSNPTILDFLVGFVGGSAAAYARTRTHLSSALAGAAIAAALVPPIATAGLQLSFMPIEDVRSGCWPVIGPILLFVANVLTIMVGSWIVLWLSGIRGDHRFGSKDRWANRAVMSVMILTAIAAVVIFESRA